MKFSIFFVRETNARESAHEYALGKIIFGSFVDNFDSDLGFWTRKDYEAQWREAIHHVLESSTPAALITNMNNPISANFIVWWPMWRFGDEIRVQSHMLVMKELRLPFQLTSLYEHVPDYSHEDEGKVSEWRLPASGLIKFLDEMSAEKL